MKLFLTPFISVIFWLLSICNQAIATPINAPPGSNAARVFTVLDDRKIAALKASLEKKEVTYIAYYQDVLKTADKQLTGKLTSVVTKTQTPSSGDKHDYLSLAPYWWPNPAKTDGLPWIRKDGQVNPLTRGENVDQPAKDAMFKRSEALATACYFSDDRKYAQRAVEVPRVCFGSLLGKPVENNGNEHNLEHRFRTFYGFLLTTGGYPTLARNVPSKWFKSLINRLLSHNIFHFIQNLFSDSGNFSAFTNPVSWPHHAI